MGMRSIYGRKAIFGVSEIMSIGRICGKCHKYVITEKFENPRARVPCYKCNGPIIRPTVSSRGRQKSIGVGCVNADCDVGLTLDHDKINEYEKIYTRSTVGNARRRGY